MLTQSSAGSETIFRDGSVCNAASAFVRTLKRGCHVLVAVSGGSDSLGLLVALEEAANRFSRTDILVSAATVDHGLRAGSADEAALVGRFCGDRKIPHETLVWRGEKPAAGLMAAARDARYGLLADHAAEIGADVIAVGHTLDDQAETFTMRKQRSGEPPVSGMASRTLIDRRVWIERPFLAVSRRAIRSDLVARGVRWIDDPSNDNPRYERVRIRQSLDGAVSAPGAEALLAARTRTRCSDDAAGLVSSSLSIHGAVVAEINPAVLASNRAAARYMLNTLVAILGGETYGPGRAALDDVLAMAGAVHGTRMTVGRCLFERSRERLWIVRERRGLESLDVAPNTAAVWDGRFRIENRHERTITIGPAVAGQANEAFGKLPARLSALATVTGPSLAQGGPDGRVVISRTFAPFARYLPGFDLTLANRLAEVFGVSPFPSPAYLQRDY